MDDAEKSLCGNSRPPLSGRAQVRLLDCGALLRRTAEGGRPHMGGGGPWHLVLVLLEILLAALPPAQRHFHGSFHPGVLRWILRAFVKSHDDVRAQPNLRLHSALGTEEMRRAIEVRAKCDAVFRDFAQVTQTENLKAAGVCEDRPRPSHEAV